jgi:hypothetical protein
MFKQESQWFKGLKHAESVGVLHARSALAMGEYMDNRAFMSGVHDYVAYHNLALGVQNGQ